MVTLEISKLFRHLSPIELQALRQVAGGLPASFDETLRNAIDLQTVVRLPFVGGEFIV